MLVLLVKYWKMVAPAKSWSPSIPLVFPDTSCHWCVTKGCTRPSLKTCHSPKPHDISTKKHCWIRLWAWPGYFAEMCITY
jgi:hypothetical protein